MSPKSSPLAAALALLLPLFSAPVLACGGQLHVEVLDSGVYELTGQAVAAAQPALLGCASADLVLKVAGREQALRVVDGGDGRFDADDRIEFLGARLAGPQSWFDTYANANVYLLGATPGEHLRLATPPASTQAAAELSRSLHIETDQLQIRLNEGLVKAGEEPDLWYWAKLTQIDAQPVGVRFDLTDLRKGGRATKALIAFRGLSDVLVAGNSKKPADHTVEVHFNGSKLTTLEWNGREEQVLPLALPNAALKESDNQLELKVPKRTADGTTEPLVDVVMFNFLEIDYPIAGMLQSGSAALRNSSADERNLDLRSSGGAVELYSSDGRYLPATSASPGQFRAGPLAPGVEAFPVVDGLRLKPAAIRAVAAEDWRAPAQGYDYLIISHARLIKAIEPLAEYHRSTGLQVALLDVDTVYDQFNHGVIHPRAIRDLIAHAYHKWPAPRPRFVLLVGDASFDIRHEEINDLNYAKWTNAELMLPNSFGGIPGTPYAAMPKDLKNRNLIPTWQYASFEGQSASDNFFVTVDGDDFLPDLAIGRLPVVEATEVEAIVNKSIAYARAPQLGPWRRNVMFITDESDHFKQQSDEIIGNLSKEGFAAAKIYASRDEADNLAHQSAITDGLNSGQLLVHFIGHGGRYIWRTGPPDLRKNHDLFTLDHVTALNNGGRLPLVLSMTCYSAPFDHPNADSIGERFLREPGKGAVAVFAASWRNAPSTEYSAALVEELVKPGLAMGTAIMQAKQRTADRTLVELYNLLGDPALVLTRPVHGLAIHREEDRWQPRLLAQVPGFGLRGTAYVDWVDAAGKTLATRQFEVESNRFRLPLAPAAISATVVEVRLYVSDPAQGRDAAGQLRVVPVAPLAPAVVAAAASQSERAAAVKAAVAADSSQKN